MLHNPDNEGRTLDSVGKNDGPWYPQCWPNQPNNTYIQEMQELVETKLPTAETRRQAVIKEMAPYIQEIARKQRVPAMRRGNGNGGR